MSKFTDAVFDKASTAGAAQPAFDAWVDKLEGADQVARTDAQRLVDWYCRDRAKILGYVKAAAAMTFSPATLAELQWPLVNSVPRIVRRLSLAYINFPTRTLKRGGKTLATSDPAYGQVWGPKGMLRNVDVNRKFKDADQYSTLLNTVHVEVVRRGGAVDWDLRLRPGVAVVPDPDDYLAFSKLAYRLTLVDPDTLVPRSGWVYWSKDVHAFRGDDGVWRGMTVPEGASEGSNPYPGGAVPVVTVRKFEQEDYWGRYGVDLVDAFEQAVVLIASNWENGIMEFGQPVATNLGLKLKAGQTVLVGPRHGFAVDGVTKDMVQPGLDFARSGADIPKVTGLVDWFVKAVAGGYGLSEKAWSQDELPESGFAKFMQNYELLETRDDMQPMWVRAERELFEKSRMVYNYFAAEDGNEPVGEDLELQVTFPPPSFPESPAEKTSRYMMGFKAGTSSPVRYFIEEEGLSPEDALKKALAIADENRQVREAGMDKMQLDLMTASRRLGDPNGAQKGKKKLAGEEQAQEGEAGPKPGGGK